MGHALAIAQGIARAQPHRLVWCLDGDGASLMHLGSLVIAPALGLANLRHVLLNNGAHESVGAQPTAASMAALAGAGRGAAVRQASFSALARAAGYRHVAVASTPTELADALASPGAGPSFIEAALVLGTRAELGRPT